MPEKDWDVGAAAAEVLAPGVPGTRAPAKLSMKDRLLTLAAKEGAPITGATMGAMVGGVPGAMLGGAAGKGYQRVTEYLTGARDPAADTSLGVAGDIAQAGLAAGAGEGSISAIGKILKWLRPRGSKLAAAAAKVGPAIPEKYGEAVFKDPSILRRALPAKTVGKGYDAFERYTGLKGLEATLVESNRATMGSAELERMVLQAANKVIKKLPVEPQELYLASQAASRLKLAAKYGEPQAQMAAASGAIKQGKTLVDDALEKVYPEYKSLRIGHFESKAKEAFSSVFPQNKGGTANVLRPWAVAGTIVREGLKATPALPAVSPLAWQGAIRAGSATSPAAKLLAKLKIREQVQESE